MGRSNSNSKSLFIFLALLALADVFVWRLVIFPADVSALELNFLDVGQGDASLIRLPGGADILIDGGPDAKILGSLSEVLPPADRYIDLVILSHPQLDHFGGFIDVLKNYDIGLFIGNGRKGEIAAYGELERVLMDKRVQYLALGEGDKITYGDSRLDILGPSSKNLASKELNETGLAMRLAHGNFSTLYTADIGFQVENELVKKYDLASAVLKVPHHGSKFSSGKDFLAEVAPLVAAIGVGKNSYGHPTAEILTRLENAGARVFRADQNGTVKIVVQGNTLQIFTTR